MWKRSCKREMKEGGINIIKLINIINPEVLYK